MSCQSCCELNHVYALIDRLSDEERLHRKRQDIVRAWVDKSELRQLAMSELNISIYTVDEHVSELTKLNLVEHHRSKRGIRRTLSADDIICLHDS